MIPKPSSAHSAGEHVSHYRQFLSILSWNTQVRVISSCAKEALGYKGIAMTLRYSHLSPEYQQGVVELLDEKSTDSKTDTAVFGDKLSEVRFANRLNQVKFTMHVEANGVR